jgi:predicted transcriptional regulator
MGDIDWLSYGFVLASSHRKAVVEVLKTGPATPSQVSQKTNLRMIHISKALRELEANDLVICLTPNLRKGRIFDLTQGGRAIADRIYAR